jgi:hypothetical protein
MGETLEPRDLEVAKGILSSVGVTIGITERFNESLHVLENVTGRSIPAGKVAVANRNPHRPDSAVLDTEIRRLVRRTNSLDVELYEYAVQLFEEQLAQYPSCTRRYFQ